jgi:D-glycero-D-manno-heptose 1,7-bisphosphate phosphatase
MPMHQLRQAVFLDRDGVLHEAVVRNGKPFTPAALAELQIPPGTKDALLQRVASLPEAADWILRNFMEQI